MPSDALAAFVPETIGFIADPYPVYEELRRAGRIHYDERTDHWLVTRHQLRPWSAEICLMYEVIRGLRELQVRA